MSDPKWKDRQLYELYQYMLKRCYRSTNPGYYRYGGRGITVCKRWRVQEPKGQGFRNFKADVGHRPIGYSLDRTDNDGNYTPQNCRWVPRAEQYRNRKGNNWITFMGVTMIAKDWENNTGVRADVIVRRLKRGIAPAIAIFDTGNLLIRNASRMIAAAAKEKLSRTHCKRNHPLSGENLHLYEKNGHFVARICRQCKREAMRITRSGKV